MSKSKNTLGVLTTRYLPKNYSIISSNTLYRSVDFLSLILLVFLKGNFLVGFFLRCVNARISIGNSVLFTRQSTFIGNITKFLFLRVWKETKKQWLDSREVYVLFFVKFFMHADLYIIYFSFFVISKVKKVLYLIEVFIFMKNEDFLKI